MALRVNGGRIERTQAAVLGGDVIKAIGLSIAGRGGPQGRLDCAVGDFIGASGKFQVRDLDIVTEAGWARGVGGADLTNETLDLVLQGHAARPKPFQVDAPVHLGGPLDRLKVKLDPIQGLDRLAVSLPFGRPRAPAPDCAVLLTRSAAFGRGRH
jgi:hypothetical protein